MAEFGLGDYLAAEGRLIVRAENFDFEAFAETALRLVNLLSARVWKSSVMRICTLG